jgi:hypothetical protein
MKSDFLARIELGVPTRMPGNLAYICHSSPFPLILSPYSVAILLSRLYTSCLPFLSFRTLLQHTASILSTFWGIEFDV